MVAAQSVLIACSRLVDLAGAEVTTLELAEAFKGLGWSVSVASFEVGHDMHVRLDMLGAHFIDLSAEQAFHAGQRFNLAWIHHTVAASRILAESNLTLDKAVFSSLSHFSPLECPPSTHFRLSRYLVHSEENLKHFMAQYPDLGSAVSIMNNSALARYWNVVPTPSTDRLARLALVSNHLSEEVQRLTELLIVDGICVDVFGVTGKKALVSPDLLRQYDAVMTIGKTVQYGIAAGVPVYCYDHFGGDGWLTPENFESGRAYNFSGRGGRGKVTAEHLKQELCDGFGDAVAGVRRLYELGVQYFVLEENISAILQTLPAYEPPAVSVTDANILIRGSGIFMDMRRLISYRDDLAADLRALLRSEQDNARAQILYRDALVVNLQNLLEAEKENARSQIAYRDALVLELQNQLKAEKENAQSQILYRDALVAELQSKLQAEKSNAQSQIVYRDALIAELHKQLDDATRGLFPRLARLLAKK